MEEKNPVVKLVSGSLSAFREVSTLGDGEKGNGRHHPGENPQQKALYGAGHSCYPEFRERDLSLILIDEALNDGWKQAPTQNNPTPRS
jgi:hypothetical protein